MKKYIIYIQSKNANSDDKVSHTLKKLNELNYETLSYLSYFSNLSAMNFLKHLNNFLRQSF